MLRNSTQNIKSLLLKVAEGNENAFGQLFKTYDNQLNGYILSITKSPPLTEEMVQDVFLKIWMNRSSLTEIESFKSYLFIIARNHTFDCLKQISRKKKREKEWINTFINHTSIETPESLIDRSPDKIEEAVKSLPCQQKKIYLLRNKGLKQMEIARKLDISVETVKKHSMLAKRFLKKRLSENITGALSN